MWCYLEKTVDIKQFVDSIDTFFVDYDGVVAIGGTLIPGAVETLVFLQSLGKRLIFITNNTARSRQMYVDHFAKIGYPVTKDMIFSAPYITALYIKKHLKIPLNKKIYTISKPGFIEELVEMGYQVVTQSVETTIDNFQPDPDVAVVVFGSVLDITFKNLAEATIYLQNPACHFLALHNDTFSRAGKYTLPDLGCIVRILIVASGRTPVFTGKPFQPIMNMLLSLNVDKNRACMIGDTLKADIVFGQQGGIHTLLVLTGVSTITDIKKESIEPEYVIKSLSKLKTHYSQ